MCYRHSFWHSFLAFCLAHLEAFFLEFISSHILSGVLSGLSGIASGILSGGSGPAVPAEIGSWQRGRRRRERRGVLVKSTTLTWQVGKEIVQISKPIDLGPRIVKKR